MISDSFQYIAHLLSKDGHFWDVGVCISFFATGPLFLITLDSFWNKNDQGQRYTILLYVDLIYSMFLFYRIQVYPKCIYDFEKFSDWK